jgi:hypothetical protein
VKAPQKFRATNPKLKLILISNSMKNTNISSTKKAVQSTSTKAKLRGGKEAEARVAGRQATAAAPPSCNQGVTKIGTERSMKTNRKTLHELTTHVPKESTEGADVDRRANSLMRV